MQLVNHRHAAHGSTLRRCRCSPADRGVSNPWDAVGCVVAFAAEERRNDETKRAVVYLYVPIANLTETLITELSLGTASKYIAGAVVYRQMRQYFETPQVRQ